ncbi:MAG: VWA domain-containing protein, partial [Acidobacteria bacterium ACB1]|nr:VWA domain-containing protein [Acidobacteria bacterium ACB1]
MTIPLANTPRLVLAAWACFALIGALSATASAATYECRTTPNGIPRKVIVKNREAVAYADANFTSKSGKGELRFFRKYFVFEETQRGFLVGEATVKASIIGWARRDDVLPWNTEQAVFLINKTNGRKPVNIWQAKEDIGQVGKPCFAESLDVEHTTEPFPILQKDGDAVKVAFLWESERPLAVLEEKAMEHLTGAGVERASTQEVSIGSGRAVKATGVRPINDGKGKIDELAQQVRRMDVVLVMDTTGSMGQYMNQVKARLTKIVDDLVKRKIADREAEVHVGVVAYRDFIDE